ncbi:beta-ketoacyl-ACP synthase II [Roseiflexus castenholzii]|jgi:3-oxoacyl-[acyl-carrier-protein] synthase II|uniref:3-oxoacyl-[acyl-carrier-protein] synthase 2 n=1 Tax=Roseiflexus castenholzii (strain DSM 13941 / HLO8) TaxID=383372 RepID=A7NGC4_ROSCS|nr:beta-ketoacyl-ACP synthase II [Roseiflexus castenholzii]ABU56511.1 Beta-ketoacyl synthase [Roseiflexus castenholzii DSM 13941]
MSRRVVVTGMGAVSPLGLDVPSLWQGIREARSGIGPITLCDASNLESRIAGEVRGFDPLNYMDRKEVRRNDRFIHLAIAAATEALRTAELTATPDNADAIGVIIGSGIGGITTLAEGVITLQERGPSRISPFLVPAMITNMASGQVSMLFGLKGPNYCPTSACASGAHAIGEAAEIIRRGWASAVVAGGSEAPITPIGIASFASAKAISTRNDDPAGASRPFDAERDGFVLAEGGAILVLEDLEFARARGARILAEIVGYGLSADAYHITQPAPGGEGALRSMRAALKHAGLSPDDIDYINAHGTSTPAGDIAETEAIKRLLGERAYRVPVSSSKSQFGHLLGAAGAIEAIVSILAIQENLLPPTINYTTPDPQCDLDYVPNAARPARVDTVLSNSFGFGGHNVSLIFRRYEEAA